MLRAYVRVCMGASVHVCMHVLVFCMYVCAPVWYSITMSDATLSLWWTSLALTFHSPHSHLNFLDVGSHFVWTAQSRSPQVHCFPLPLPPSIPLSLPPSLPPLWMWLSVDTSLGYTKWNPQNWAAVWCHHEFSVCNNIVHVGYDTKIRLHPCQLRLSHPSLIHVEVLVQSFTLN